MDELRQTEALAIAACKHIKHLETQHKAELTKLIKDIIYQGVFQWGCVMSAVAAKKGLVEVHSLDGDTGLILYEGAMDDWLFELAGPDARDIACSMLFTYGRLPVEAEHITSQDFDPEEQDAWEDETDERGNEMNYYWPRLESECTQYRGYASMIDNPWPDAPTEFPQPPIKHIKDLL